jgi:hypothetical protein
MSIFIAYLNIKIRKYSPEEHMEVMEIEKMQDIEGV